MTNNYLPWNSNGGGGGGGEELPDAITTRSSGGFMSSRNLSVEHFKDIPRRPMRSDESMHRGLKKVLVVGPSGSVREQFVDPNKLPQTMQRVQMTPEKIEQMMRDHRERTLDLQKLAESKQKVLEEERKKEKEKYEFETKQLELTRADRERQAAEAKAAAEEKRLLRLAEEKKLAELEIAKLESGQAEAKRATAIATKDAEELRLKRKAEENRATEMRIQCLEAEREEREQKTLEAKRLALEAEKEAEALRIQRVQEENRATELTIKALELQRHKDEIEAETKLLAERNKSVEMDLKMQSINDWKLECAICLNASSRFAVIPCGHYVLCDECSKEYIISEKDKVYQGCCPMCRVTVEGLLRIFIATKV